MKHGCWCQTGWTKCFPNCWWSCGVFTTIMRFLPRMASQRENPVSNRCAEENTLLRLGVRGQNGQKGLLESSLCPGNPNAGLQDSVSEQTTPTTWRHTRAWHFFGNPTGHGIPVNFTVHHVSHYSDHAWDTGREQCVRNKVAVSVCSTVWHFQTLSHLWNPVEGKGPWSLLGHGNKATGCILGRPRPWCGY